MKKLLVICGPTATGKTNLGIKLAKKFNGELISADSRQVYIGMDIGTGKDLPKDSRFKEQSVKLGGYYSIDEIKIWGYDLVDPKENFSVAQYAKIANEIIANITLRGKLPILVGGTGLYIKAITNGIDTADVPKDENFRKGYKDKNTDELFEVIAQLDPVKAASMNISDRKNPNRLIRALEIADYKLKNPDLTTRRPLKKEADILFIGLKSSKDVLNKKVDERIENRVASGFENELTSLLKKGVDWKNQSMSSLGYKQWKNYAFKKSTKKEAIKDWKTAEKQYAKRQITWFKRDLRIKWFDIGSNYQKSVEKLVKTWDNS